MTPKPDQGKDAEELLKAANDAAGHARILYVTLMLFLLYCAITAVSVTDEQLFRDGPIAIPLLPEAKVPVSVFFLVAPILALLLHLDVLLHFHGLAEKVRSFDLSATSLLPKGRERLRHRFAGFPFLAWLANPASLPRWVRWLYGVIVYVTLVLAPLGVLLLMQVLFLKYQSVETTWVHRLVILGDCALVWNFWPRLASKPADGVATMLGPRPNRFEGLRRFLRPSFRHKRIRWLTFLIAGASFCLATVIGEGIDRIIWGPMSKLDYIEIHDFNRRFVPFTERQFYFKVLNEINPRANLIIELFDVAPPIPLDWRRLNLRERFLTGNQLPPEKQEEARNDAASVFEPALKAIEGIDLRGRNLRFIDLADAALPKGDFRYADLSYARMQRSDVKIARFDEAKLVGADLSGVNAVGGTFVRTDLLGADLSKALLVVADFTRARLDLANLSDVQLLGSNLISASFRGAAIVNANFSSSMVYGTKFDHTIISDSNFENIFFPLESTFFIGQIRLSNSVVIGEININDSTSNLMGSFYEKLHSFILRPSFILYDYNILKSDEDLSWLNRFINPVLPTRARTVNPEQLAPTNHLKRLQEFMNNAYTRHYPKQYSVPALNCIGVSKHCEENFLINEAMKQEETKNLNHHDSKTLADDFSLFSKFSPYTPRKYFSDLLTFICSVDFSDLPTAAAKRLVTPAHFWANTTRPQSPKGGDWPNFRTEAEKTWQIITNTSCKDRFKLVSNPPKHSFQDLKLLINKKGNNTPPTRPNSPPSARWPG